MRRALLAVCLAGCPSSPSSPAPITAASVAAELVDAGCVVASGTLAASVQAELSSDAAPAWLSCLAGGGSVGTCGAPCSGDM